MVKVAPNRVLLSVAVFTPPIEVGSVTPAGTVAVAVLSSGLGKAANALVENKIRKIQSTLQSTDHNFAVNLFCLLCKFVFSVIPLTISFIPFKNCEAKRISFARSYVSTA
jgi:hypothetical protein